MAKSYYIQERHNPQLKDPYYTALGQITKKKAKKIENPCYGYNYLTSYVIEEDYLKEIQRLKDEGYIVHDRS